MLAKFLKTLKNLIKLFLTAINHLLFKRLYNLPLPSIYKALFFLLLQNPLTSKYSRKNSFKFPYQAIPKHAYIKSQFSQLLLNGFRRAQADE